MAHCLTSVSRGHAAPPAAVAVLTVRLRVWNPVPQVLVQDDHSLKAPTTQSTGQTWVLQLFVCSSEGQPAPPVSTCTMMWRLRRVMPLVPQDLLHALQSPKEDTEQSRGHECVLHCAVAASAGQLLPPCSGCCATVRCFVCTPVPHEREHSPNSPKPRTMQSTAHAKTLQSRDSPRLGHT